MNVAEQGPQRVQKLLAAAGYGSRRTCEQLIRAGRVTVDGEVARLGDRADPASQEIRVDAIAVRLADRTVVYLLNKPQGVISAAADDRGRQVVTDLVPDDPRVYPVGRLDRDTEGLLLLTNDGELAHALMHPSRGVPKTYVATVQGRVDDRTLRRLRTGVELDDGPARATRARVLGSREGATLLELTMSMGRNRVIRRMCAASGLPVRRLVRTSIGPLRDPNLPPGGWRRLTTLEIASLEAAATAE